MAALNEFTVVRGLHWMAIAGVFLLLAPRAFAGATILEGNGSLGARMVITPEICNQPTVLATFSAPIGNPNDPPANSLHLPQCSTTNPNTGEVDFVGPIDLQGGFTGNAQSMTLTATGSGSEKADVFFFRSHEESANTAGDIVFEVTGEPTQVPISVSMTVHCEAACGASCILRAPDGQVIGEITADNDGQHGSFPTGALSPGLYSVQLNYFYQTLLTLGFTTYNFNFSATIVVNGTGPTPTPSPIQWNNPAGGSFQTAANWDPQMVPGSSDTAVFGLQVAYLVDVGAATTERLEIRNGDVTFTNANYTVAATDFVPSGTVLDNAVLTLLSGTLSGIHALIGESAAARVNVFSSATLNYTGSLQVGGPGHGTLFSSGFVFSGEGRIGTGVGGGTAMLDGIGALWDSGSLSVGFLGSAEANLFVSGGATLLSDIGSVGFGAGSDGFVQVEGEPSTWTLHGDLTIGEGGVGELQVLAGGFVSCPNATVGLGDRGTALISGIDQNPSKLAVSGQLTVGKIFHVGSLDVNEGAEVSAHDVTVGSQAGADGFLDVQGKSAAGPSFLSATENIILGLEGTGRLTIAEDAIVTCSSAALGVFAGATGEATLGVDGAPGAPAQWVVNGDMMIGGIGTGSVVLHNGANVAVSQTLFILTNGSIGGTGTYSAQTVINGGSPGPNIGGKGTDTAPTGQNGGTIAPGNSPGLLTLSANLAQNASGKLKIQAGGLSAGQFDVLHVTGNATLDGTLEVTFLNGYLPRTGDTFRFLEVDGSITGQFAQVVFPQLVPGFQFDTVLVAGGLQFRALNDAVLAHRTLNISTRMRVETGQNALIGGFILTGNDAKKVILRAIGPSLAGAGLTNVLQDPTLELYGSNGALIASNDNWRTGGQEAEIIASTIPPTNDLESAVIRTLPVGAYTVIVRGNNGGSGVGLVEAYDLDSNVDSKLANISTRGLVQTGDDVMIGGFIAGGGGGGTNKVVVRGIGPSLADFGVQNALPDPTLELRDGAGALIASNDNWKDTQQAEIEATGLPPANDLESAIVATLAPGPYTAIVRGKDNTTGVGLVEVYNIQDTTASRASRQSSCNR